MSNYDKIGTLIETLYETNDKLIGVRYSVYDAGSEGQNWIDAIEMSFETGTIATIYVEVDFDTLRLELSEMELNENCFVKVVTSVEPWSSAKGNSLTWIWLLTNNQGYEDGFRFEFSSKKENTIITFIGIASTIQIYVSQEIKL